MADDQGLGDDDYGQLHSMLMSSDPSVRVQGQDIAKKLTPDEQQSFFSYQKKANAGKGELTRQDASVGGLPPEVAAVSAIPAIGVMSGAGSLVSRVTAAIQRSAGAAAPYVKYQASRGVMRSMGIPDAVAEPVAWIVAGYKGGKPAAPEVPTPKVPINAVDYNRIKQLMDQGISQGDAVRTVTNLRFKGTP